MFAVYKRHEQKIRLAGKTMLDRRMQRRRMAAIHNEDGTRCGMKTGRPESLLQRLSAVFRIFVRDLKNGKEKAHGGSFFPAHVLGHGIEGHAGGGSALASAAFFLAANVHGIGKGPDADGHGSDPRSGHGNLLETYMLAMSVPSPMAMAHRLSWYRPMRIDPALIFSSQSAIRLMFEPYQQGAGYARGLA